MSSRGSGLTLMAVVLGLVGYFIFQSAIGINTKVDDPFFYIISVN